MCDFWRTAWAAAAQPPSEVCCVVLGRKLMKPASAPMRNMLSGPVLRPSGVCVVCLGQGQLTDETQHPPLHKFPRSEAAVPQVEDVCVCVCFDTGPGLAVAQGQRVTLHLAMPDRSRSVLVSCCLSPALRHLVPLCGDASPGIIPLEGLAVVFYHGQFRCPCIFFVGDLSGMANKCIGGSGPSEKGRLAEGISTGKNRFAIIRANDARVPNDRHGIGFSKVIDKRCALDRLRLHFASRRRADAPIILRWLQEITGWSCNSWFKQGRKRRQESHLR